MTDSTKNTLLVVVVLVASLSSLIPSTSAFTQDLQQYTSEISKRSFSLEEMFHPDSLLMKLGAPVFKTLTFIVAFREFVFMACDYFPPLRSIMGMLGMGGLGGLPMLAHMPTEMTTARDGESREQRMLDDLDHQVKTAVANGQSEFENELKKKKK